MFPARPLEVAFLTNFSDTCFRAIPALAQMCDDLALRLTLVHALDPTDGHVDSAEARLRSFFPEADRYPNSRRRVVAGTAVDVVRQLKAEGPLDLVMVPAGEPLGLPRLTRSSIRAQLLDAGVGPMWTIGAAPVKGARPTRSVACCLHVGEPGWGHLKLACDYAATMGAALHVVHVLPSIDDGSLLRLAYAPPFDEATIARRVQQLAAGRHLQAHMHVVDGHRLAKVIDRACDADVVFVDGRQWVRRRWLARRLSHTLDAWHRPVICVDTTSAPPAWPLARRPQPTTRQWPVLAVSRRRPALVSAASGFDARTFHAQPAGGV